MPLGQRIKRLPGNKLLRHLPLEFDAVRTLSGHGFLPSKAQHTLSIHSLQPVRLQGRAPRPQISMYALPPKVDIVRASRHVCFVPEADITTYSITSSARARSDGGMVKPIAFAVVRLIAKSNLVGCSTGKSPGFAPRKILSTKSAARRNRCG